MAARNRIQLQIDTTFVSNTQQMVKSLEQDINKLNLSKPLNNLTTQLTKQLKTQLADLEKQLNVPGKSKAQYTKILGLGTAEIQTTINQIKNLKNEFKNMFNSTTNKENLAELDKLKNKLEELRRIGKQQKTRESYLGNSISKLEATTNSKYAGSNITQFKDINKKYKNSKDDSLFTDKQKALLGIYSKEGKLLEGQEGTLKNIIKYIEQILTHEDAIAEMANNVKTLTGNTSNADIGAKATERQINNLGGVVVTPEALEEANKSFDKMAPKIEGINQETKSWGGNIEDADQKAREMASVVSTIKDIMAQFGLVWSAAQLAGKFKDLIKYSYEFYKSLDSALNEIYVVSNLGSDAVKNLTGSFINMAEKTGMSIDDVTTAAVLFYQQGLNTDAVMTMTEVTAQFAKVAGTDATDAADKLTAAINGYCLAADDAASVADKFNQVAAASAADIDELSTAFSKAAAQANQAGVSMDNYLAYIATMEEATREAPENIGTGLKTIFSRMQQVKEGGTTEDGDTDVNQVETSLKSVGIALRDTNGELRDLEEVFDELGPKWQSLDRNTQAYLGTIIAGTRQQSRFITLMQNWDRVLELAEESENSAGMQALMHAKAMDSVESATQQLNVAWQEFVSNLTDSTAIKDVINFLTTLLKRINSGRAPMTVLNTALTLLSLRLLKIKTSFEDVGKSLSRFGTSMKATWTSLKTGITSVTKFGKTLDGKKGLKGLIGNTAVSFKELQAQSKQYEADLAILQNQQNAVSAALGQTQLEYDTLTDKEGENADKAQELAAKIEMLKQQYASLSGNIEQTKTSLSNVNSKIDATKNAASSVASVAGTLVGVITTIIGAMDKLDTQGGQLAIGWATLVAGVITGIVAISTAMAANPIGAILTAITMAITGVITLIKAYNTDVEKMKKEGLTDAVDSLSGGLDELQAKSAGIKASDRLMKKYNQLTHTIHRTAAEQQELNNIVQELGDTYGIDIISDAYGNLSIHADDVVAAIEKERKELESLKDDMKETESEALQKALDSGNSIQDYLDKVYGKYSSDYKSMIVGFGNDLSDANKAISDSTISSMNSYLKNNLLQYAKELNTTNVTEFLSKQDEAIATALNKQAGGGENGYEKLYAMVDELQNNIDDMTYADVQAREQEFFEDFGKNLGITQQQWDLLTDSINSTVYGNDSLTNFMNSLDEKMGTIDASGSKWTDPETGLLTQKGKEVKSLLMSDIDLNNFAAWSNGFESDQLVPQDEIDESIDRINELIEEGYNAKEIVKQLGEDEGWANIYIPASNEGEKKLDSIKQGIQEYMDLYEDYQKRIDQFKTDNNLDGWSDEDVQTLYSSMQSLQGTMSGLNMETANFLSNSTELLDFGDISASDYNVIVQALQGMSAELQTFETDAERYAYIQDNLMNAILKENPSITAEGKQKAQDMIDEWFEGLSVRPDISWNGFANEIKSIGEELEKVDGIMDDLADDGHITMESFLELGDVLTELATHMDELGKLGQLENFGSILGQLNVKFDESTQSLMLNGEAMKDLAQLETVLAKAKLMELQTTIDSNLMAAEAQKIALDSEIAATDATIAALQAKTESTITGSDLVKIADANMTTAMQDDAGEIQKVYQNLTADSKSFATASVSYIQSVAEALRKLSNRDVDFSSVQNEINKIQKQTKWGGYNYLGIDTSQTTKTYEVQSLLEKMNKYKSALENTRKTVVDNIEYYKSMKITIGSMLEADDLSGLFGGGSDSGNEIKIEKYIGKLEEIYNVMRKIEGVNERLSHIDAFMKIAKGADYARYALEKVDLTQQEFGLQTTRLAQQKYREKYEQNTIKGSAVGNIFDFDEYGNIIMDWEKYDKLSDKTIDGMQSQKELADELYEEYKSLHEETQSYYEELIDSLEGAISAQQDLLDTYYDMEKELASAVKDIYQQMLDNKLDAIDTEIEALDKLSEAYDKANQAASDSKELSGMQTSMKRAMMDTSGASNTKVFDYRDQIASKLENMGQDAYTQRLDDIKQVLEEQKESLQADFDEFFEDFTQLYELINTHILPYEDAVKDVLSTTKNYKEATAEERVQILQDASTQYQTITAALDKSGTMMNIVNSITTLADSITYVDGLLKDGSFYSKVGTSLSEALYAYEKSYQKYASGGLNTHTGPAWLDGTKTAPEAVLNAAQTQAFMSLTSNLAKLDAQGSGLVGSNVIIDNISFEVESMSSPEDGEKAFDAFVNRFKEIGSQTGLSFNKAKI